MNTHAVRVGRLLAAHTARVQGLKKHRVGEAQVARELSAEARALVDRVGASGELRRLLEIRVPELIAYQDAAYAREYVDFVARVADAERRGAPGETRMS